MLIVGNLCGSIVSRRRPGREGEQQARVVDTTQGMVLAGVKCDERSGLALHGLCACFDRDPAGNHLHDGALADVMIAHFLSAAKVEHDDPALG
jgi:hypothetical protein